MPTCQKCKRAFSCDQEGMVAVQFLPFRPNHLPGFQSRPLYEFLFCKPCAMVLSTELLDDHKLDPQYASYESPG